MLGGDRQMTPVAMDPEAMSTLRKSTEAFRKDPDGATQAWGATTAALQQQHGLRALADGEREMLVSRLPPHYMLHALAHCLDRDERAADFLPWTAAFADAAGRGAWLQDRSQCLRLGTQALLAMMRAHLVYMSGEECRRARAPYKLPKDMLRKAFWRVDPRRSGYVSLPQFMQVWQNILQLWEYDTAERVVRGRARRVLVPARRRIVDRNAAAAVFVRFGFDKAGHLPYEVFIQGINESPARLLGHGLLLNKTLSGRNGVENLVDVALLVDDAKVDYPKSAMGVFPPSGFDERLALRSMKLPRAHMWLEHVYGYAGFNNLANNLFFTHNTTGAFNEVVFYAGMLGVVATWIDGDDAFGMRQRFFFGHDNDVLCLAAHPNRRFVATGQQTSTAGRPYACVWDIGEYGSDDAARLASGNPARMRGVGAAREPVQLQRLEVDKAFRSILAVAFSGDPHAGAGGGDRGPDRRGGELLVTLCGDNHHTVHVWRWMVPAELPSAAGKKVLFSHCKAMYIPSWHFGPEKKLPDLAAAYPYYSSPDDSGPQRYVPEEQNVPGRHLDLVSDKKSDADTVDAVRASVTELLDLEEPVDTLEGHPLVRKVLHKYARSKLSRGFAHMERMGAPNSKCEKIGEFASAQGTPPTVYGAMFNPLRPSSGRGCEFLTYGIKHLKTWVFDDAGRWHGTAATFGPARVQNVLCAAFVPAQHAGRAPGDSCIVSGFSDGSLGLWVPPFPTVAGARYALRRTLRAHNPGPLMTMVDGSQQYGGVKCLTVCQRPRADGGASTKRARETFLLSGGADGTVRRWHLRPPPPSVKPRAPPPRGAALVCADCGGAAGCVCDEATPTRIREPCLPDQGEVHPMVRGLDWHPSHPENAFIVGTSGCDLWRVTGNTQRAVLDGHSAAVHMVAPHPEDATRFVTADESGTVLKYNTESRLLEGRTVLGFRCYAVAISNERYSHEELRDTWCAQGPRFSKCWHIAVSGRKGRIMVLKWDDFQPLANIPAKGTKEGVCDLKFTPAGAPTPLLAAASHDQHVYIYNVAKGYQLQAVCSGSSGTVEHLDWSYALISGPLRMHGRYILQSNDASREVLHWDGLTGRKVTSNQRDALWSSWTCTMGFPVLGVWPDFSDGTDINAVARSARGAPVNERLEGGGDAIFHARRPRPPTKQESADGVPGAHVIATADDFSLIKLFNGPVVADDAPYRAYRGHASHVMCVRFSHDDRRLFSVGGIDRCVFQWRTVGVNGEDAAVDAHVLNAVEEAALRKHQRDHANVPLPRQDEDSWLKDQSIGAATFRRRLDRDCQQLSSFHRSLDESLHTRHLNRTLSIQKPVPRVESEGVTP